MSHHRSGSIILPIPRGNTFVCSIVTLYYMNFMTFLSIVLHSCVYVYVWIVPLGFIELLPERNMQ